MIMFIGSSSSSHHHGCAACPPGPRHVSSDAAAVSAASPLLTPVLQSGRKLLLLLLKCSVAVASDNAGPASLGPRWHGSGAGPGLGGAAGIGGNPQHRGELPAVLKEQLLLPPFPALLSLLV